MATPTLRTYAEFASVFDTIGLANAGLQTLQTFLHQAHLEAGYALDLGCGTGQAIIELAKAGWEVSGIDRSPEMLSIAKGRTRDAGVDALLLEGDILQWTMDNSPWIALQKEAYDKLCGSRRARSESSSIDYSTLALVQDGLFDLVVCVGDTLSEFHEEGDLDQFCDFAAQVLCHGGLLVFDTRTPAEYETWDARDEVLYDAGGLLTYTQRDYHPQTEEATCHYVWFAYDGERWWRDRETHTLYLWRPEVIYTALSRAGFHLELEQDLNNGRVMYAARKLLAHSHTTA